MPFLLRAGRVALGAAILGAATPACYTAGQGTPPPMQSFYYPTGLTVSAGGNVLYAVNSDFDLQWNGGTLQSYDLFRIRRDAAQLIQANLSGATSPPSDITFLQPWQPNCLASPPPPIGSGLGVTVGQNCAPPVDQSTYVLDSAIVGAFATDLQVSNQTLNGTQLLFSPISGNGTVTWAKLAYDDPKGPGPNESSPSSFAPFHIDCGLRIDGRCDSAHQSGNDPNSIANTRNVTIPGQPFGLAQSEEGSAMAVTSETATQTALLTTGFGVSNAIADFPTMQFVLDGVPNGGVAIAAVPHDPDATTRCQDVSDREPCLRPAFLQTSMTSNEVDLLRYYDDNGAGLGLSSPYRPYLQRERAYTIDSNVGTDFRGIAIDPTPRLACKAAGGNPTQCGQIPARVFIASRTPPSLVIGEIGVFNMPGGSAENGFYDPDGLNILCNIPLPAGPSKVYLAPVVMPDGPGATTSHYEVRVFVVLFDSNQIAIINPEAACSNQLSAVEALVGTGPGPFAMAFDPFSLQDVAAHAEVPRDPRQTKVTLNRYRFGYVGVFTQSYLQVLDLDLAAAAGKTYGRVVYTLGAPTLPKGQSQSQGQGTFL